MGRVRQFLGTIGNILFWIAGLFALLVFFAARTGTPPTGTVMENCEVYGIENYGHPVVLGPEQCVEALERQSKSGKPVSKGRPKWATFVLSVAEMPFRFVAHKGS